MKQPGRYGPGRLLARVAAQDLEGLAHAELVHPVTEDRGVDAGALEREHLVAGADAALREDDLPGWHLLEQREGALEVEPPVAEPVLDQERIRVEELERLLD